MFNIPIDAIRIQDIEQFLQSGVREGTLLDFKEDFPKRLDKTISSMANTFGGMILIGVEETATGAGIVPIRGLSLGPGLRERVIQIGVSSVYPPLIPEVSVVEFKSDPALATPDKAVVVIRVHESEQGHAVDDRSTIYIRADNVSDRMRKATVEEVEWFLQKRQKSVTLKNRVIEQTKKHAHQFLVKLRHNHQRSAAEPFGRFVIWTIPSFPRSAIVTPKQLYDMTPELVRQLPGSVPGSFPYGLRRPVHDGISWANEESRFYCYTEIHQLGLIYSEFEFWWDQTSYTKSFLPHAAAKLLHAAGEFSRSLYRRCGYFGSFDFVMRIVGVRDRTLVRVNDVMPAPPRVMDDVTDVAYRISAAGTEEDMVVGCKNMMRSIYWAFGRYAKDDELSADFK